MYVEFDFILRPEVKENLKMYHAVFKIGVGWHTGYEGCHCVTNVSDPLQSALGRNVPPSHLAVSLTAKTKGTRTLQENIHEKFLTPFAPSKKGTLCMVIKEAEDRRDGESVGAILSVAISLKKNRCVSVAQVDGSTAKEVELAWDRVIEVEIMH